MGKLYWACIFSGISLIILFNILADPLIANIAVEQLKEELALL